MATTSLVVEEKKFLDRGSGNVQNVVDGIRTPLSSRRFKTRKHGIYHEIYHTSLSIMLIAILLYVYKVAGFHDLWIQMIGRLSHTH